MRSFIRIPSRYDVRMSPVGIEVICTDHSNKPHILRLIMQGTVGVDEIILLVESHELVMH